MKGANMLSWNRSDQVFLDQALDPVRRHKLLGALGWRRVATFIMTLVYMIALPFCSLLAESPHQRLVGLGSLAGFGILFSLIYGKLQSEVLLLKYIDRLERDTLAGEANSLEGKSWQGQPNPPY